MEYQQKMGLFSGQNNNLIKTIDPFDKKIYDLASGFASSHFNDFVQTKEDESEADQARALTLSKTVAKETEGLYYSVNTTTLFEIYYNDFEAMRNFDFREQVYKNFIDNLGYPTMHSFVTAQLENNYITPSHMAYIKETLDLLSGNIDRRKVSNESWSSLLYHNRGNYIQARTDIRDLLQQNTYEVLKRPYWELISIWLNTAASITDLIWFNKLVWGRPLSGQIQ